MENVIRYELDNGLNVVLLPQSTAPVVACNVWVGVGSADEEPHEAGLAHVHEHMLFKGTQRRGVGEIAREVESAGGHINAFTSFDQTCYYVVTSSRFFASSVDILADAIRNSAFDADELGRELEVIQEEIKRGNDDPNRVVSRMLFETAYTEHPYRLPVIGTPQSVDSFDRDAVVSFFRKHYRPDNMTVILAGDFEEDEARELISTQFGDFETPRHAELTRVVEPEQSSPRVAVQSKSDVQNSMIRLGFHVPDVLHEDIPAIDVLGAVMGQGDASHLHRRLVRDRELVTSAYAGAYTPRDAGLFVVAADYQLDERHDDPEAIIAAVLAEVAAVRDGSVAQADVDRARTLIEGREIFGKETVEGLAMRIGHSIMVTGDPEFDDRYYAALARVKPADVQRVARAYLTAENLTLCVLHPQEQAGPSVGGLEAAIESSFAAPAAPAVHVNRDDDGVRIVEIPGGPRLLVQEDHSVETFAIRALNHGGLRFESAEENGVSWIVSTMLTHGTPTRSAEQIADEVEAMASSVDGISGRHTLGLGASGLTRFFEPTFEVFADCLVNSSIPDDEFAREQRVHVKHLHARNDRLATVNSDRFIAAFFPNHPYALPAVGTPESIESLSADTARAFLKRIIRPRDLVIGVVGDVDTDYVAALVEQAFANASSASDPLPDVPRAAAPQERKMVRGVLAREQAFVTVGFEAPVMGADERYVEDVVNAILSGQGGRLFGELRDKQSLAYSVYASRVVGLDGSAFTINIGTSPDKVDTAVEGIFSEVERLRTQPPTEAELNRARRYLMGSHDIGLQRPSSRAMSFALDELYGFGYERTLAYGDQIAAVTATDVASYIDRYLDAQRCIIAITAPES